MTIILTLLALTLAGAPPLGWTGECTVIEVVDGDTITVEIRRTVRVRLVDCWAPEKRAPGGKESRDNLIELAKGRDAILHVEPGRRLGDMWTFDRLLGRVWVVGDLHDLSHQQVIAGHAERRKP